MKHFLLYWNIGAWLLFAAYALCFTHLAAIPAKNSELAVGGPFSAIALDIMGLGLWYLVCFFYEMKGANKWIKTVLVVLTSIVVACTLLVNIQAVIR